jgi:hypothetical protein
LFDAACFLARHRVAAEKARAFLEGSLGGAADCGFGAAGIGYESVWLCGGGDCGERVDCGADGQGDID